MSPSESTDSAILIPKSVYYTSREGWVQVLETLPIERGDTLVLDSEYSLALAIKDREIGIVVVDSTNQRERSIIGEPLFEFDLSTLGDFLIYASALHVDDVGTSYVTSIIEHVILNHWKPRVFTRTAEGYEDELDLTIELTPSGASKPLSFTTRVNLICYTVVSR